MVLSSLFGKKKGPVKEVDRKSPVESAPGAGSSAQPFSAQQYAQNAKNMAQATTDKIDKIESEMMGDHKNRSTAPSKAANNSHINDKVQPAVSATTTNFKLAQSTTMIGMGTTTPSIGQSTDILLGDSMLSNAIELSDSISNPAVEESAILFAYGQAASAAEVLHESIGRNQSNHDNVQAWLMLLELYQATNDKAAFESLAIDYALRFESSAPTFQESSLRTPPVSTPVIPDAVPANPALIQFEGPLDVAIVPLLDQLKRLTPKHHTLHVDFTKVTQVEPAGAELILRMLKAFAKSNHVLVVQGPEELLDKLLLAAAAGQNNTAWKPVWMLLLDVYRLLDRQAEFEQKSMDYCVTYEVSPPSWEPYSVNIKPESSNTFDLGAETIPFQNSELPSDTIALSGELLGKAENDLSLLTNFASGLNHVCIDCSALRRVDFTAGGALLNWAMSMQGASKTVEFKRVSHLVSALFVVMGLHEVALIERRT